jgi:hypothetical protein
MFTWVKVVTETILTTAKALGLTIPEWFLVRVTEMIE